MQSNSDARREILDAASAILAAEGPHALSMRRLAAAVGASTIVLYTHFADKQEILNELYLEGFARLEEHLRAVAPSDDPLTYVADLGRAYRRSALAHPTAYQVMFSGCLQDFTPTADSLAQSTRCFDVLRDGVRRCSTAGLIPAGADTETAQVLWGTLHGLISLELLGYWGDPQAGQARLEQAIAALATGLTRPT